MNQEKEKGFFEKPGNIRKLWILLYVVCGLFLLSDFFVKRDAHFGMDSYFGFYSVMGFISCAVLILVSKLIGFALKKKEDYYD